MMLPYVLTVAALLAAPHISAQYAPAIAPSYFAPSSIISPVLLPNPVSPSCKALIYITETQTTGPLQQEPTASQVASSVTTDVNFQVENLNATDLQGFEMDVDLPLDVLILNASGSSLGPATAGLNSTVRFEMATNMTLPALSRSSVFINTTMMSANQDVLPRNVYIAGSRCAIGVAGFNPATIVPTSNLFSNLQSSTGSPVVG